MRLLNSPALADLEAARAVDFRSHAVLVHTVEFSIHHFVVAEPNVFKNGGLPNYLNLDHPLLKEISRTAILASISIYCNR